MMVTNNGTQCSSKNVANFYKELGTCLNLTSMKHPQENSQVESTNKIILYGLKMRLEAVKGLWVEELPMVL